MKVDVYFNLICISGSVSSYGIGIYKYKNYILYAYAINFVSNFLYFVYVFYF